MARNLKQFMPLIEGLVYDGKSNMVEPPTILDIQYCLMCSEKDGYLYKDIANPEFNIWTLFLVVIKGSNSNNTWRWVLYDNKFNYIAWNCYGLNSDMLFNKSFNINNIISEICCSIQQKRLFDELIKYCVPK